MGLAGGLLIDSTTVLDLSSGFSTYLSMTALAWAIVGGVGMVSGGTFSELRLLAGLLRTGFGTIRRSTRGYSSLVGSLSSM